jgi:hypothetical protein
MNQILHIFRKDSRRFWIEILLSTAVTIAYMVIFPSQWKVIEGRYDLASLPVLLLFLTFLIPISWWILVTRVVQSERLVGDTQFWITRPYEWKKLVAGKALFLAVWIGIPYAVGQILLIFEAGFHPLDYLPVVLMDLLFVATIAILPLFAVATVAANFARMTLTLLGGVALILAAAFGVAMAGANDAAFNPLLDTMKGHVFLPLLTAGCASAIILIYATRRSWATRGVIAGIALLLFGLMTLYSGQALVGYAYSGTGSAANTPLTVMLSPYPALPTASRMGPENLELYVPVIYSGVAQGYAAFAENLRFTLKGANGSEWTSPWQQTQQKILPGDHSSLLSFWMSRATYNKFQSTPVTLRIEFAVTRLQADKVTTVAFPTSEVAVPDFGICFSNEQHSFLFCRSVVRQRRLTAVDAHWTNGPCGGGAQAQPSSEEISWTGELEPSIELPLPSVETSNMGIVLDPSIRQSAKENEWRICPGSPMTLTQYHLVDRTTVNLTLSSFTLPPITHRVQ